MFRNLSIGSRLYAAFAAVIAVLVVLVAVACRNLIALDDRRRQSRPVVAYGAAGRHG